MPNRRDFIKQLLSTSLSLSAACAPKILTSPKQGDDPPPTVPYVRPKNVLMIAVDDLNDWLGCYTPEIAPGLRPQTPNIDAFASQAMLFENAYTPIALCNPARTSIFFGVEPHKSGVLNNYSETTSEFYHRTNCHFDEKVSLNHFFRKKRFETIGVGKLYHNSSLRNTDGQWDDYQDVRANDPNNCLLSQGSIYDRIENGAPKPGCPDGITHIDTYSTNWALGKLDRLIAKGKSAKPFFMGVGFMRPHAPWYAPNWCWDKYSDGATQAAIRAFVDEKMTTPNDQMHPMLKPFFQARLDSSMDIYTNGELYNYVHGYLATITFVDSLFGELINKLKSSHLWQNTTVLLWSDHGYHWGEKHFLHKQSLWERATRIPLLWRVPGFNEGTRSQALVSSLGLYKTLTHLCFDEKPNIDGESFHPVLQDPMATVATSVRSALSLGGDTQTLSSIKSVGYGVREKDWRYILYRLEKAGGGHDLVEELYYLPDDPKEKQNLVLNGRGNYAAECTRLRALLPQVSGEEAPLPRLNCGN